MPGDINDENSLVRGMPVRTIGPETGSYGNAIVTNEGDTGEGTNQGSSPAPAAGIGSETITTSDLGEHHSVQSTSDAAPVQDFPEPDIEPGYQQIADGGDHYDHHKHLHGKDRKAKDGVD